jgi:AcrR family transcriptional regulator
MDGGAPSEDAAESSAPTDAPAATQERLLGAAVELVLEHHRSGTGLRDVFAYLNPSSVAEHAGVSRGLIYHYWGDDEVDGSQAFGRFLSAVADRLWAASAVPEDLAAIADLLPPNRSDLVVTLVRFEMERFMGPDRALFRSMQALTLHGAVPAGEAGRVLERLTALYRAVGGRLGLEPVPPLTFADVAFTVMCVLEGFSLFVDDFATRITREHRWEPATPTTDPDERWTLPAIAVDAVVRQMMRDTVSAN